MAGRRHSSLEYASGSRFQQPKRTQLTPREAAVFVAALVLLVALLVWGIVSQ